MRKRLVIAGHSAEGIALIPHLEANPEVEVCAILTDDAAAARRELERIDPRLLAQLADSVTDDVEAVLRTPELVAIIDADLTGPLRSALNDAPGRGIQVTTPLLAKLLFAFGPLDPTRKPDLLQALTEILESYNMTIDRGGLLNRILQIAVGSTGADRGSLMLWDEKRERLCVDVAIGIEPELLGKIQLRSGEGIAGRAFADRRPILLNGRADRDQYDISRERSDVESAISAPLLQADRAIGVLNLAHSSQRGLFTQADLVFVQQLAQVDAKIIARSEEYHSLLRDSTRLRAQSAVHDLLAEPEPLVRRLSETCRLVARDLNGGICHIYLLDTELDLLLLRGSSTQLDPLAAPLRIPLDDGIHGHVARTRRPVVLSQSSPTACICFAVLPLLGRDELLGVISFEGTHPSNQPELLREKISATADALSHELADALRELRMEREATKTTAIMEFGDRMSSITDLPELHRTISSAAAMVLEAEHAVLRLRDDATGQLQLRSYFGSADPGGQEPLFELEKQLSNAASGRGSAVRIVDVDTHPEYASLSAGVPSALAYPLRREGRVIGTLSVLGKVSQNPLAGESFSLQDQSILERLGQLVCHALDRVGERERSRHRQRNDELTGLPNATSLAERLDEEIARSGRHGRQVALVRLRVGGLADLLNDQVEAEGDRLVLSIAHELRAGLREFDVLARSSPDSFEMLLPEPDGEVSSLLGPLARRASEAIRRELDSERTGQLSLEFGYAVFPDEGATARALLERSRSPRITAD